MDWPLQQWLYKHTDHCHLVHCLGWRGKVLQSQQKVAVEQSIYSQTYYGGVSPWEGPLPKENIGEQLDCLPELALVELEMEGGWALQLSVGERAHSETEVHDIHISINHVRSYIIYKEHLLYANVCISTNHVQRYIRNLYETLGLIYTYEHSVHTYSFVADEDLWGWNVLQFPLVIATWTAHYTSYGVLSTTSYICSVHTGVDTHM